MDCPLYVEEQWRSGTGTCTQYFGFSVLITKNKDYRGCVKGQQSTGKTPMICYVFFL
jgi:hypothetical protein